MVFLNMKEESFQHRRSHLHTCLNLVHDVQALMLSIFELNLINICFDEPLACRSQMCNEGTGRKHIIVPTKFEKNRRP